MSTLLSAAARWLPAAAGPPVDPDRDTAQRLAVEELSKREYRQAEPGIAARVLQWLWEQVQAALDRLPANGSALFAALVAVGVLAIVLVVAWVVTGPVRRTSTRRGRAAIFGGTSLTAHQHRAAAAQAAAVADWRTAIQETFRATIRSLEERAVLDVRPGLTAAEASRLGGAELPAAAGPLAAAAHVFDDVTYGDRPGDRDGYETATLADRLVAATRPSALVPG